MQVLTYNIAGNRGRNRPDYLERIAELILSTDADAVGLQEVVHHPGEVHPELILARLTGMHVQFLAAHHTRHRVLGNAVLTRETITGARAYQLPGRFPEPRMVLEAITEVNGRQVSIFNTHLVHLSLAGRGIRRRQAAEVARLMSECPNPHVLVGDLNASPHAHELHSVRKLSARHDHHHGLRSWPAHRPMIQYDHIWPGPGWEIEQIHTLDPHVSDHRPVFARLKWRSEG